jgi:crotonobetainyl-CoA:carnitine CoA-transferase CaiB-like acyl-CoA transferase
MTLAGGIMGALFHRLNTGEATTVDVSLLGSGMWAMGQAITMSVLLNHPWGPPPPDSPLSNPLVDNYITSDGRWIALCCLQADRYWPDLCKVMERPELAADPRFSDHLSLIANNTDAAAILKKEFAERSLAEWRERLRNFIGQWAVVQNSLEAAEDPQTAANGYIYDCETANGSPFRLVGSPVRFGDQAAQPIRAPAFNEHGDQILADLGLDWETIVYLKVRGVVA